MPKNTNETFHEIDNMVGKLIVVPTPATKDVAAFEIHNLKDQIADGADDGRVKRFIKLNFNLSITNAGDSIDIDGTRIDLYLVTAEAGAAFSTIEDITPQTVQALIAAGMDAHEFSITHLQTFFPVCMDGLKGMKPIKYTSRNYAKNANKIVKDLITIPDSFPELFIIAVLYELNVDPGTGFALKGTVDQLYELSTVGINPYGF